MSLFFDLQMQIERWLTGKLIKYINDKFFGIGIENREVSVPNDKRKKIDLKIELNGEAYWIELKHIFVGCQHENKFDLKAYFYNGEINLNIANDIKKLRNIPEKVGQQIQSKFILVFLSANKSLYERCKARSSNFENYYIKGKTDLRSKFDKVFQEGPLNGNRFRGGKLECYDFNQEYRFGFPFGGKN